MGRRKPVNLLHASLNRIQSSIHQLVDFTFPPQCALCAAVDFPADERGVAYCPDCLLELCPKPRNRCECCGAEIGLFAKSNDGCIHCRKRTLRFDSVACLGMYDAALKQALLSAKWSFSAVRMKSLGALLACERMPELQALQLDRILPIPQHWRQRLVRHFNPAWIIATELSKRLRIPCDVHLLQRSRRARPQKRVSVSQRFENQNESFSLRDVPVIRGQRLLIVDDVLTTGATCSEAAKLLKRAGAKSCHVAVLARVLDHSA